MKLAIDVMGFENDPKQAINAVMDFSKHHKDVEFVLFGNKQIIGNNLVPNFKCEVIDCPDVVNMDDSPIAALRKPNSSMYQAIKYVADNKADGVLSAGSTACYVTLTCSLIKNLPGIDRPAFMPYLPTQNGKGAILLDVGANKECSGFNLYQFAKMAKIYVENVRHIHNPTIGVINIGSEKTKGFSYHHEADELLANDKSLNYKGFVETRFLLSEAVDIAVCDGYTGNIALKALEGCLKAITTSLKTQYKKPWNWLGALFSINAIKNVKKTFDYKNNAGALVIGLNKIAVKTHGSADYQQFSSSLRMLYESISSNIVDLIKVDLIKNSIK